jgi:hypothetical protein
MLASNLNGDEILSAAKRFFPGRLRRWQLGPRSAESRKMIEPFFSSKISASWLDSRPPQHRKPKPESQEKEK